MNDCDCKDKLDLIRDQLFKIRIALAEARVSTENTNDIKWELAQIIKDDWDRRMGEDS